MLRIRLLGELRLELEGRRLDDIASRRARSLLGWLAYHPGLHPRTRVAAVFWPDVLEQSSRASLRTTLATLRRELGEAARFVVAERERVGLEESAELSVDVAEIERLIAAGRHADALALCRDELLVDLDDDWVLEARQAHRERVGELLVALGETAEAAGDVDTAVIHARRRLELDPVSEDAARVLMRRLAESGDRAAAVASYEAFRGLLQRELGMAPSGETRALAELLRTERRGSVGGVSTLPLPPALAHPAESPLVGRSEPLAALRAAWRRARAGPATIVTVDGEAGSGKTRLLIELAEEARAEKATVLAGRCTEDGAVAYAPFTEALRPYVAAPGAALPEWVVGELARLLPELEPDAEPPEGEPKDARHRLFEAVAAAIGHAARQAPVLLIVEDLHRGDRATLGMLAHVIRTLPRASVLVAGSLRDEGAGGDPELRALLGELRRERRLERVAIAGLSEEETGALAGAWLDAAASPGLAAELHRRTGGNPFFVEELVRHLVESNPGRSIESLVGAAGAEVPEGVRSLIDRRLARLPERAGQAVRVAAVAGEDFALRDVAAACEEPDDAVAEGLDGAVAAGLVDEGASAGCYRFAHALVRQAVLAGLSGTRRALLHRRLAEVLEALPGERRLPEVARHLLDARPLVDAAEAAGSALRAAEHATRALAYEDAAELLARAADGDLDEREPLRAEVLLALADAYQRMGDAPAASSCFEEAAGLARALESGELLARAALGAAGLTVTVGPVRDAVQALLEEALDAVAEDSGLRPRLLARLAIEVYYERPATLRERLSSEALDAGRRAGGRGLLEALGARHVALWSPDHTEERLAIADELVAAAQASGDREAELQGVNWRVADLFELGELDGVRPAIADHARLAAALRLPAYDWYVPMWRATLAVLADRLDDALRLSEEGARIGRSAHDDNAELLFEVQRNFIDGASGRMSDEAYDRIRRRAERSPAGGAWRAFLLARTLLRGDADGVARAVEGEATALAAAPRDANWLYTATVLGVLSAHLGDERATAELYPLLLPYGHRIVTVGRGCACCGSASLALGLVAATLGDVPAAVAHLEEALRRNELLGAVAFAAAARHALAHLPQEAGTAALLWLI